MNIKTFKNVILVYRLHIVAWKNYISHKKYQTTYCNCKRQFLL